MKRTTWATVCEIMATFPGAKLDEAAVSNPAWRVNGRVVVRRNPRLDGDEDGEVIAIRTDPAERAALMSEDPNTFFLTDHWAKARSVSVLVRLGTVDQVQLTELLTEAWAARATRQQRSELR